MEQRSPAKKKHRCPFGRNGKPTKERSAAVGASSKNLEQDEKTRVLPAQAR